LPFDVDLPTDPPVESFDPCLPLLTDRYANVEQPVSAVELKIRYRLPAGISRQFGYRSRNFSFGCGSSAMSLMGASMKTGRHSQTAQSVATLRAVHQIVDEPKVFHDPLALRVLGQTAASAIRENLCNFEETLPRALRAAIVARSRYVEDKLAFAVQEGISQFVVLGAGLDTFAYRNPYSTLRVFEVDHPATQEWKRSVLEEAGITVPGSMRFAPTDFESSILVDVLVGVGFNCSKAALFSWLGVSMYLTKTAVLDTLRFVATALPERSGIVFDYCITEEEMNPTQRRAFDAVSQRAAAAGEPWQTFFSPVKITSELKSLGFSRVEEIGNEELNAQYFSSSSKDFRVRGFSRLAYAIV
jgi:methyltransferase (TIGR00027 family)